jgi:hypothetical protein
MIDILLSTYNGERHLASQLDSILAQTFSGWRLLIRDDGSSDATLAVIDRYVARAPEKIRRIATGGARIGPCQSFSTLLEASTASYVMFCDQDDVWLPEKVEVSLRRLQQLEARHGSAMPLAVFTDLKVVDEDLRELASSFWSQLRLRPHQGQRLNRLLFQSVANGCTMIFNAALRARATPIPPDAVMHDWWLMLVAAAFGRTDHVDEQTVLYRQHGANVCGADRRGTADLMRELFSPRARKIALDRRQGVVDAKQRQAAAFQARYAGLLPAAHGRTLRAFLSYPQSGFFMRRYLTLRHGFLYGSLRDNVGMLLFR